MNSRSIATLRLARAADVPTLAAMSRDLIESGLDWRYTPGRLTRQMLDPDTVAVVACEGSRLQGFAVMKFGELDAHLMLLCVEQQQQRRGIGRQLMQWLLQSARVAGTVEIALELRADNATAEAFYRQLGFVPTQLRRGYYDGRVDARCMLLRLGPQPA